MKSMKRIVSMALLIAMIFVMSVVAPITADAADTIIIADNNPAICADTGVTVDLSDYAVYFGTTLRQPSEITWKNSDTTITSIFSANAGRITLTATAGGATKNIYFVTKAPTDKDYVLYSNDFSNASTINSLRKLGAIVEGGYLTLASGGYLYAPSWIGEFGNYKISANVRVNAVTDTSRWMSLMWRSEPLTSGKSATFYQMCIRKNAAATNGVEVAYSNNNTWQYPGSFFTSFEYLDDSTFYNMEVSVFDDVIAQYIDGQVMQIGENSGFSNRKVGEVGIQTNGLSITVDSFTVSVQATKPVVANSLIRTRKAQTNITNATANIAVINTLEQLEDIVDGTAASPTSAMFWAHDKDPGLLFAGGSLSFSEFADLVPELDFLPIFYIDTTSRADEIHNAMKAIGFTDFSFASSSTYVLKYAAGLNNAYRGMWDIYDLNSLTSNGITTTASTLEEALMDDDVLLQIRGKINSTGIHTVILPSEATRYSVNYIQSLCSSVWIWSLNEINDVEIASMITTGAQGFITYGDDYLLVEEAMTSLFAQDTLTKTPLVIGHRGNPSQITENSLGSFARAIENGADVVEIDIYMSSDGYLFINHDNSLSRTTNGNINITTSTYAQIKQYTIKNTNEKVPTLDELLDMMIEKGYTDKKIFVEIKDGQAALVPVLAEMIEEYDCYDQIAVISFSGDQLRRVQEQIPQVSTGYLVSYTNEDASTEDALYQNFLKMYKNAYNTGSSFNFWFEPTTPVAAATEIARLAIERGETVWPWTYEITYVNQFTRDFKSGVHGLTTNHAQLTTNWLKEIYIDGDITVSGNGGTVVVPLKGLTYGGEIVDLSSENLIVTALENDNAIVTGTNSITSVGASGSAKIMVGYKFNTKYNNTPYSYTLYTEVVDVAVADVKSIPSHISTNASLKNYSIDDGYFFSAVAGTTGSQLASKFTGLSSGCSIHVYDFDGNEVTTGLVANGYTLVQVLTEGTKKTVVETYSIIVFGDLVADGKITAIDYFELKKAVLVGPALEGADLKACSIHEYGKVTARDYFEVKKVCLIKDMTFENTKPPKKK